MASIHEVYAARRSAGMCAAIEERRQALEQASGKPKDTASEEQAVSEKSEVRNG